MNPSREDLASHYQTLNDEVLLARYTSGTLTELAQSVALEELQSRGIDPSNLTTSEDIEDDKGESSIDGDLKPIARHLTWAEAHMLCTLLESEGIDAFPINAHLSTANQFLSTAAGGVRVLVHETNLSRALEVTEALKRGDYSIDEDHDVGAT